MKSTTSSIDAQSALIDDRDFLREMTSRFLQNLLDEEFLNQLGARRYQRSQERQGYRNGHYERQLTRVGRIELLVPRDREGNSGKLSQKHKAEMIPLMCSVLHVEDLASATRVREVLIK